MAFLMQATESPYWRVPVVDAGVYDQIARDMLRESWLGPLPGDGPAPYSPYFQPPLYQWFLALLYLILGQSVIRVMVVQYLIGSLSCVLTYLMGCRFFGRGVGVVAGVATALTASQIFYEGRLLPPVLITIFNLSIILLASEQQRSPAAWRWPAIGILIGLSAITRPDILLFAPALLYWMWRERQTVMPDRPLVWASIVVLLAALPVGLVSLRNAIVGRDPALISYNGGVNFYIGNHPEMEKGLAVRPGTSWDMVIAQPTLEAGITRPTLVDRYFYRQAFQNMMRFKRLTVQNTGKKLIWVWRGQEIRRNEDDYYFTRVSPIYRALLWRVGDFGFPFGVIAPLGLLGIVLSLRRRRDLFLLCAYLATQVVMLVAFFPCSRYRAPIVPVLIVFAAFAGLEVIRALSQKRMNDLLTYACLLVGLTAMTMLSPPRFEGSPRQIEAENHGYIGHAHIVEGRDDLAIAAYLKSLQLDPNNPDAHKRLAFLYSQAAEYGMAERHLLEFLKVVPNYGPAYGTLHDIYERTDRHEEARRIRDTIEKMQGG